MAATKTYIAVVLDKSGSMSSIRNQVIEEFNKQIEVIKDMATTTGMDVSVSLIEFNHNIHTIFWNEDSKKLEKINDESYVPRGETAFYDAAIQTIENLKLMPDVNDPNVAFLVLMITDGIDNKSAKTKETLGEMIQTQQDTGNWTFTYIGANQNVAEISTVLNVPMANTMAFMPTVSGYAKMSDDTNNATTLYMRAREAGIRSVNAFYNNTTDPTVTKDDTNKS